MKNEKTEKKKEKNTVISMIHGFTKRQK